MATVNASFPPATNAPHDVRAFVRDLLREWDAEDLAMPTEILVSELVSNVVRHANSTIDLDVSFHDNTLSVEVRDGSSIVPAIRDLADAEGGFGLRIVEAVADEWGVTQFTGGKAVWFKLSRHGDESAKTPTSDNG
jgi:anti-sigma regulatory factor (Ser/Thr protein kinase)